MYIVNPSNRKSAEKREENNWKFGYILRFLNMESSVKNESENETLEELKESLGVMPVENRASIDQAARQTKEGKEESSSKPEDQEQIGKEPWQTGNP